MATYLSSIIDILFSAFSFVPSWVSILCISVLVILVIVAIKRIVI